MKHQPMTKRPFVSNVSTKSPGAKPMGVTGPPRAKGKSSQQPRG